MYDDEVYYCRLKKLDVDQYPMNQVLDAVDAAIPKMKLDKKYQLKQIVELGEPGLWERLESYTVRCIGHTFAGLVEQDYGDELAIVDYEEKPYRYVRLD